MQRLLKSVRTTGRSFPPLRAIAGLLIIALFGLPLALPTNPVHAQDGQEWEWDPTWGYHEEEWYDPSDWFNDDGTVNYEDFEDAYYGGYYDYDYNGTSDLYDEEPDLDNYYGADYFTDDWYAEEADFDNWWW